MQLKDIIRMELAASRTIRLNGIKEASFPSEWFGTRSYNAHELFNMATSRTRSLIKDHIQFNKVLATPALSDRK